MASKTTTTTLGNKPYASPFYSIGKELCQNMFLEFAQSQEAKATYYLLKIAGLKLWGAVDPINLGACRGMVTTGGFRTFAVFGTNFVEILGDSSRQILGQINTIGGVVSMAENGSQLIMVDGSDGWIFDFAHNTFLRITDANFPGSTQSNRGPTHVCYLDTYFIVNIPDSNRYLYSESYYASHSLITDSSTPYDWTGTIVDGYWDEINSGAKIGKSDNIVALANCNNYLWLFGLNSNEVHYDTGVYNDQLFSRYEGAILNYGCGASNSVATYANQIFWLASDISGTLAVFTNEGMIPKRISTRGIEQIIEGFTNYSDCIAYTYAQSGHAFYVMQFPSVSRTFVYDMLTDSWHERTYLDAETGGLYAWKGMFATHNFDKVIMGDNRWSSVYESDPLYYQNDNAEGDGVNYIRCCKNTPILFSNGVNVRYNWVQVICNQGSGTSVNTAEGVGANPTLQIAYSNDTGINYVNERVAPIGKQGDTTARSIILGCGMGRNRVYRITMTDPVPFILVCLLINGEEMRF